MLIMAVRDYCQASVISGYHIYKAIWMHTLGQILQYEQERENPGNSYTVNLMKDDITVGHIPREKSCMLWYFMEVLPVKSLIDQNTVKVPCRYILFHWKRKNIETS